MFSLRVSQLSWGDMTFIPTGCDGCCTRLVRGGALDGLGLGAIVTKFDDTGLVVISNVGETADNVTPLAMSFWVDTDATGMTTADDTLTTDGDASDIGVLPTCCCTRGDEVDTATGAAPPGVCDNAFWIWGTPRCAISGTSGRMSRGFDELCAIAPRMCALVILDKFEATKVCGVTATPFIPIDTFLWSNEERSAPAARCFLSCCIIVL